ncbi:MAG: DHH family phosphoesterase [Sarcina sp.]
MYFKLKRKYVAMIMILFSVLAIIITILSNNFYLGYLMPIVYIVFLSLVVVNLLKKQEVNDEENRRIAKEIKTSLEDNVLDTVYPAAVVDSLGNFFWVNKVFKDLYKDKDLNNNRILAIVKGMDLSKVLECDRRASQHITINDVKYEVYGREIITEAGEEYCLVNFSDVNNKDDGRQSIVFVQVDNLEEIISHIKDEEKPILLAEIEKTITLYAKDHSAMIKKYDTDKYMIVALDSEIDKLIKSNISLLDVVRKANIKSSVDVTLSIGIGRGGETPLINHELAEKALELALGRGGDQIVMKTENDIKIFGGNTAALEKTTKVRARVVAHALRDLIYESSNVIVLGHKNPDMDCLGSGLAMAATVKALGTRCNLVLDSNINSIQIFLDIVKSSGRYDDLIIDYDDANDKINAKTLIIVTDVHSENYIANIDLLKRCDRVVIIDHHRKSMDYVKNALLNYIEVYASSTSELVTELIQYMLENPKITQLEAEGLLAGIFMDTKNFTFKTGVRTFEAAAFLRKMGADTLEVNKLFNNDFESYLAKFEMIKSAEVKEGIAISVCPSSISELALAAQVADELINIVGIECSFVFVEIGGKIHLSARSLGHINVQVIMEALGGGGHRTMAGTRFVNMSVEEAKNKLKKALNEYLRKGDS